MLVNTLYKRSISSLPEAWSLKDGFKTEAMKGAVQLAVSLSLSQLLHPQQASPMRRKQ